MKRCTNSFIWSDSSFILEAFSDVWFVTSNISEEVIKSLQHKFKIKQPKTYDLTKSPFCNYVNSKGIDVTVQGHTTISPATKEEIRYPIVVICEDIRKLENLMVDMNLNANK